MRATANRSGTARQSGSAQPAQLWYAFSGRSFANCRTVARAAAGMAYTPRVPVEPRDRGSGGSVEAVTAELVQVNRGRIAVRFKAITLLAPLTLLIWCVSAQVKSAREDDYLQPDLRDRVEKLKIEAQETSFDVAVLSGRLATLWEWANAYSLTGGPVPGGFPQLASNANRGLRKLPSGGPQIPVSLVSGFIAQYAREFQIKDENPDAIGRLTLSSNGPFRAGEFVTVSETYQVGERPMAAGGGIAVGQGRGGRLQTSDPAAANFVSVRTSNPDARFEPSEPWGTWATFETRKYDRVPACRGGLGQGRYRDAHLRRPERGRPRTEAAELVERSGRVQDLPGPRGNGWLLTPEWPALEVIGEERIRFVNAIAPSVVEPGEKFALHVRSEDRFRNLASGSAPALEVQLDGETVRRFLRGAVPCTGWTASVSTPPACTVFTSAHATALSGAPATRFGSRATRATGSSGARPMGTPDSPRGRGRLTATTSSAATSPALTS